MASNASTIAADIIAQMEAAAEGTWPVPYTIAYRRLYMDSLESLPKAGTQQSILKVTIAPVNYSPTRIAWGAAHVVCSLGIVCEIMVADPTSDAEIDPLEQFVENLSTWLVGPRKFAAYWNASAPNAIFGDDYVDGLYSDSRFLVAILVDFFSDGGVS